MDLKDQHVVIIGGSAGIGFATAQLAYTQGARVTIISRSATQLQEAATTIGDIHWISADINDEQSITTILTEFNRIDHLYIAAGSTKLGSILGDEAVNQQLEPFVERLWGAVYAVRAVASRMPSNGSITFTGGLSTDRPVQGAWVSGIGTAAAEQLARVLALELAPLRVNAVAPGWTDTPMWDRALGDTKTQVLTEVANGMPTKRLVRPEEVAEAVVFLMRNESMTGEIVHVDGGARLV